MTVVQLYQKLNEQIPSALSCDWDNDGEMCIPLPDREVHRVLVTLDITEDAVQTAIQKKADVIISHHPLLFRGIKHMTATDPVTRRCIALCRVGIAAISFHTRLDALPGGVNDALATTIGLTEVIPYESQGIAMGRMGILSQEMTAEQFASHVAKQLNAPSVLLADTGRPVRRVAVLGGSGGDDIQAALAAGADTYVTGEASYHHMVDAPEMGLNLIVAGHFYTEQPVCQTLANMIRATLPDAQIELFISNKTKTISITE